MDTVKTLVNEKVQELQSALGKLDDPDLRNDKIKVIDSNLKAASDNICESKVLDIFSNDQEYLRHCYVVFQIREPT